MGQPDECHHAWLPDPELANGALREDPAAVEIEHRAEQGLHPARRGEGHGLVAEPHLEVPVEVENQEGQHGAEPEAITEHVRAMVVTASIVARSRPAIQEWVYDTRFSTLGPRCGTSLSQGLRDAAAP